MDLHKMTIIGKAFIGWALICLVIVFSGAIMAGLGTFVVGIGIFFIVSAIASWVGEIEERDRNRDTRL